MERGGGLREYFTIIVDSSEVRCLKPDKKIFKILLQRLHLKPQECLYIDDTVECVAAAKKLGFKTVHFTQPGKSVKRIRKALGLG
jgi:HAD superfamily hydrolase (TIGR01509 family)